MTDIVVATERDAVIVTERVPYLIETGVRGPDGPPGAIGPQGASGSGVIEIPFAFGDATPKTLVTAGAGKLVYGIGIHISMDFDGAGAALQIGDAGDPARLVAATENAPGEVGSYVVGPNLRYGAATVLILTITPGGGASQGAGLVTLQLQQ